jgi:Rad3-related DNA helicase
MQTFSILTPDQMGLPRKFTGYRNGQDAAIYKGVVSPCRFVAQSAPVGFGKSVNVVAQSILRQSRTVILTATKGLQDQYYGDFSTVGLVDQRGRANYPYCGNPQSGETCETGPCMGGLMCKFRNRGCLYDAAVMSFNKARLAVTNYAWWLAMAGNPAIHSAKFLVLDEAHDAPDQLEKALSFDLLSMDVRKYASSAPPLDQPDSEYTVSLRWTQWARGEGVRMIQQADALRHEKTRFTPEMFRAYKKLNTLGQQLLRLGAGGDNQPWVWERLEGSGWRFTPLHPGQFAETLLFRGAPHVLATSGTINNAVLQELNLDPATVDCQDYPSPFSSDRAPVYLLPTGIRNTYNITDAERASLLATMDNIIGARLDRKGIIHSVSFERQRWILENSRYRHLMFANVPGNHRTTIERGPNAYRHTQTAAAVAAFKSAGPGAVLVSPSVSTGYNFPGTLCEYQILPKLPFINMRGRVMIARSRYNPNYANQRCAKELQQMCGRGMRFPKDRCETFILDASGRWFFTQHRDLFNAAFWQFFRWADGLPGPAPKLPNENSVTNFSQP